MATVKDREQEAELRSKGWRTEDLDIGQPKVDMWRHTDGMNEDGKIAHPAGMLVANQPAIRDHQLRMAVKGFLPWKIEDCIPLHPPGCKGCRERVEPKQVVEPILPEFSPVIPENSHEHNFRGKKKGAKCYTTGCTETRPKRL